MDRRHGSARRDRPAPGPRGPGRAAGGAAPLPARGLPLARVPPRARPRRHPGRRHGPGEDRPDPRPALPRQGAADRGRGRCAGGDLRGGGDRRGGRPGPSGRRGAVPGGGAVVGGLGVGGGGRQVRPRPGRARGGPDHPQAPHPAGGRGSRRGRGGHQLHAAAHRREGVPRPAVGRTGAGRGAVHQEPHRQGAPGGPGRAGPVPAGHHRHAHGELPLRPLGAAGRGRARAVPQPPAVPRGVHQPHRGRRAPGADRAAAPAPAPVHAAPRQGARGQGPAAEAGAGALRGAGGRAPQALRPRAAARAPEGPGPAGRRGRQPLHHLQVPDAAAHAGAGAVDRGRPVRVRAELQDGAVPGRPHGGAR